MQCDSIPPRFSQLLRIEYFIERSSFCSVSSFFPFNTRHAYLASIRSPIILFSTSPQLHDLIKLHRCLFIVHLFSTTNNNNHTRVNQHTYVLVIHLIVTRIRFIQEREKEKEGIDDVIR